MIMHYNASLNDTYLSQIQFSRDQYKAQIMLVKAVDTGPFVFDSVIDYFKNQKICYKVFSENAFMLKYCLDKYKTKKYGIKLLMLFLPTLTFILD